VELRARADRIDLLAGGRIRIVDYKLGRADSASRSIQLPVYAHCARSQLAQRRGGEWEVAEAAYLAFGRRDAVRRVVPARSRDAVADGVARLLDVVEGVERGEFPPRPADLSICRHCGYVRICRKEYVGEVEADPAL
jgi:RecB family exonuclease